MVVLLHGAAGGWDELAIALVAIVVLWGAVKLAGRKPATDEDEDDTEDIAAAKLADTPDPAGAKRGAGELPGTQPIER